MSSRHFRKVTGDNVLPPPDDDDEYEPSYSRNIRNDFTFLGVESSSSHSERENDSDGAVEAMKATGCIKKTKKKKRKQRKNKIDNTPLEPSLDNQDPFENIEGLDEIDKSLLEVNALLGPAPPAPVSNPAPPPDPKLLVMAIRPKYLNAAEEMNRLFGPDEDEQRKRRGRHNQNQWLRRTIILPDIEERRAIHFVNGLSMTLHNRENDLLCFSYNHNKELQKVHHLLLMTRAGRWGTTNVMPQSLDDPTNAHVEGLIDTMDVLFVFEQYSVAKVLVEQALTHLQRVADNLFNITNPKVRLEYKFRENRAFHILVLKYLYLVTNRACHRTALELAKVLLNLDPSDPLAVLLIIDTLALRAREHQWLIDAVEYWSKDRNADCMFNIQYSNALAHFHVLRKKKGDMAEADRLLQLAVVSYPTMVLKLYECCSIPIEPKLLEHPLFKDANITNNLGDLMTLYAKLCWSRWKEPLVLAWFKQNVDELVEKYYESDTIQDNVRTYRNKRLNLFQVWPNEIIRHLCIIKPMANLLVDGAVPDVGRHCPFNPCPPSNGIDRYNYDRPTQRTHNNAHRDTANILYNLFHSLLPMHNPQQPANDEPDEDVAGPSVVRTRRPRRVLDPVLRADLQRLMGMDTYNPHDPMGSNDETRRAYMELLINLFEDLYQTEMENRQRLRAERAETRARTESEVAHETRQTVEEEDTDDSMLMYEDEQEEPDTEEDMKDETIEEDTDEGEIMEEEKKVTIVEENNDKTEITEEEVIVESVEENTDNRKIKKEETKVEIVEKEKVIKEIEEKQEKVESTQVADKNEVKEEEIKVEIIEEEMATSEIKKEDINVEVAVEMADNSEIKEKNIKVENVEENTDVSKIYNEEIELENITETEKTEFVEEKIEPLEEKASKSEIKKVKIIIEIIEEEIEIIEEEIKVNIVERMMDENEIKEEEAKTEIVEDKIAVDAEMKKKEQYFEDQLNQVETKEKEQSTTETNESNEMLKMFAMWKQEIKEKNEKMKEQMNIKNKSVEEEKKKIGETERAEKSGE